VRLRREGGPPLCIGHRGAAALASANTRGAIEAALAAGVDIVEIDVLALPGVKGLVLAHSARETAAQPLALDDALGLIAQSPAGVLLDVKSRGGEPQLVESIRRHDLLDRALASTTDLTILRELARREPRLARSVTYPRNRTRAAALARLPRALPRRIAALLERARASAATLNYRVVTPEVVTRCHATGAAVLVWTVNDPSLATRLAALGVDGLITDNPAICRATLEA
jgi:glycerophosphoryl diester phosphodiesterase